LKFSDIRQANPALKTASDFLIIKKRAEPAFTSAEVRHASKSCSRGRFFAISYTLKNVGN